MQEPSATINAAGTHRLAATDENGTTHLSVVNFDAGAEPACITRANSVPDEIEQLELRLEELDAEVGAAPVEISKTPRTAV